MKIVHKGPRKPPRGGHRAALRRDILMGRVKLAALVVIGGMVTAGMIYANLRR